MVTLPTGTAFSIYNEKLQESWEQASRFAGENGRIATLPDIISARLATKPGDYPWEIYFTTRSAEYFGMSKAGNPIIIVAHGIGPLATIAGIAKAYRHRYATNRKYIGGRITLKQFRDLESGKYGDVAIVDVKAYMQRYEFPFSKILTADEAASDPLVTARLGPQAQAYIAHHAYRARVWHAEQSGLDPGNRYNFPAEEHAQYVYGRNLLHARFSGPLSDPYILKMEDPRSSLYGLKDPGQPVFTYISTFKDGDRPIAHLLGLSALSHMHHNGHESLVCDIYCSEGDGARFVAMPTAGPMLNIVPGFEHVDRLILENWPMLLVPSEVRQLMPMSQFITYKQQAFLCYPKSTEPQFAVTSFAKVGNPVLLRVPIHGYYGIFRYEIEDIQKIAPEHANAYSIVGDIAIEGGDKFHRAMVQFYQLTADISQRILRVGEIKNNYDTLLQLVAKAA